MSWIAGIDYSTHAIDVVLIDEDGEQTPQWNRCHLEGADALERTRELARPGAIMLTSLFDDVIAVGIEEPAGRNPGRLFRVQGAVLARIPRDTLVTTWMPSQWRKAVGLPGNASKNDVAEFAMVHAQDRGADFTLRDSGQDCLDAYCIALATLQAIEKQAAA